MKGDGEEETRGDDRKEATETDRLRSDRWKRTRRSNGGGSGRFVEGRVLLFWSK